MTERRQTDNDAPEQGAAHRALKRRGLIAGAAALVAGMVAKQSAQPVAADGDVWQMPYNSGPQNRFFSLINLNNTGSGVGIYATSVGDNGVYGSSRTSDGVYGNTNAPTGSGTAGVLGVGNATGNYGVAGNGGGAGYGVYGFNGTIGVRGDSTADTGVYGTGKNYGVRGDAGSGAGAAGLLGVATSANAIAFGSVVVAPATIAGYFNGEVHVEGPFYVDPVSNKHGVIAHADGSKRVLYSMESPESWIEDFGKATLVNGVADVTIDKDFAAVSHMDDYHLFLTEYDAHNDLFVTKQNAGGFVVRAKSGAGKGSFSYRIVAKPNVGRKVERMPAYRLPFDPARFTKTAVEQTAKDVPPQPPKKKP